MEQLKSAISKHLFVTVGAVPIDAVANLLQERFPDYTIAEISEVVASAARDANRPVVKGHPKLSFIDLV
jgi:hypothetical protein